MSEGRTQPSGALLVRTAKEEAATLRHRQVDTCHVLLALLKIDGIPKQILGEAGVTYSRVRTHVVDVLGEGEGEVRSLKLTPRAMAVLQEAQRESPDDEIRPEHALLGLLSVVGSGDFPFATDPLKIRQDVVRATSTLDDAACSFCGTPQKDTAKLIAGRDGYVCASCVVRAATVAGGGEDDHFQLDPNGARCWFCRSLGQRAPTYQRDGTGPAMCGECARLCQEILRTEAGLLKKKYPGNRDLLKCSFCGKTQKEVKKLVAGPGAYICDECVAISNRSIAQGVQKPLDETMACGFCGKTTAQVDHLIAGPGVHICGECIDLCNEIFEEELPT